MTVLLERLSNTESRPKAFYFQQVLLRIEKRLKARSSMVKHLEKKNLKPDWFYMQTGRRMAMIDMSTGKSNLPPPSWRSEGKVRERQ